MNRYYLRNGWLVWNIVLGLSPYAVAQCPTQDDLLTRLQQLERADPRNQVPRLLDWQRNWQRCGYPIDSTYVNGLLQLGLAYQAQNELVKATQLVEQAVGICRVKSAVLKPEQPAKALYRLSTLLTEQHRPATATLNQVIRQGRGIRAADRWVARAYLYLAYAYNSVGDFQPAISKAETGELMAGLMNDKTLMAELLQEKIIALTELSQYAAAHQAAEQALRLAKQGNYPLVVARAYQVLGGIAEKQNRLTDALQYMTRGFAIAQANGDVSAPNYQVWLGKLYTQLGHYDKAIVSFHYGFDHAIHADDKAYALAMLGQVYARQKSYGKALDCYQRGIALLPIGFRSSGVTSLPAPQAIRLADQKEYLLTLVRSKATAWLAYATTARPNRWALQQALATYHVADQMIDFMRWEQTGQQSKLYWRQTTRGVYEQAIETCYQLGNTEQAFRFMEKSRAVMLMDKLNELGARQQLTEQQQRQEKQLQQLVSDQQKNVTNLSPTDRAAYQAARMALGTKQDSIAEFRKRLERSNPAYYGYKYDTTVISLGALQNQLKRQSASFITYFVGDSALYVLGVTPDKATLYRQPVRTYQRNIRAFMNLLADPDAINHTAAYNQFLLMGHALYNQLLAPFDLPPGCVIVSPDGPFVPFETLSRRSNEADYLVKEYAFSYVYSARLLVKVKQDEPFNPRPRTEFLGVAPVQFAPSLRQDRLLTSDQSLARIANRFRAPELLVHQAATRRAFLTRAPQARIIQLFTHATADSTDAEPTLYFADTTLHLSDLTDGNLSDAQLVVLAACKTGVGVNQRGEGVFSLARGFAASGVSSVVTTLWSVRDDATYTLTELFYGHLAEGLPKDIALQKAKQDWLKDADQSSQLPTVWGGLLLIGDAQPLALPHYGGWLIGGGVLLISGVGGWWLRRRRPVNRRTV